MDFTNAILDLQAAQIAQTRMLKSLIASHPRPEALRAAWKKYATAVIADAQIAKAGDPDRRAVHESVNQAMTQWSGYLEDNLPAP